MKTTVWLHRCQQQHWTLERQHETTHVRQHASQHSRKAHMQQNVPSQNGATSLLETVSGLLLQVAVSQEKSENDREVIKNQKPTQIYTYIFY